MRTRQDPLTPHHATGLEDLCIGKHDTAYYHNHPNDLGDEDRLSPYQKGDANHRNQLEGGEIGKKRFAIHCLYILKVIVHIVYYIRQGAVPCRS